MIRLEYVCVNEIIKIDDLTIGDKSVTCVVGQSGSGKTTLLRLLNNLDSPDEGEIRYHNELMRKLDPIILRRKITMVAQTPVIFDGTIRDNLLIGMQFAEQEAAGEQKMKQVLDTMALNKELDTDASDLSGGEEQRLALARALLLDAEVFLLDEPSSALDDTTARNVIQAFADQIRKDKKAIVMITHDRKLAELFADSVIDMDKYSLALPEKEGV